MTVYTRVDHAMEDAQWEANQCVRPMVIVEKEGKMFIEPEYLHRAGGYLEKFSPIE